MCINLTGGRDGQTKHCFLVHLWGYFLRRLAFESTGSVKYAALPNVGGHHSISWGPEQNKKRREEEEGERISSFLPPAWLLSKDSLLFLTLDLPRLLQVLRPRAGTGAGVVPLAFRLPSVQRGGCALFWPLWSHEPIPYNQSLSVSLENDK